MVCTSSVSLISFSVIMKPGASGQPITINPISELLIWNHDDKPLRSDVVPQAISLARVQNCLGANSGII
jgi:hypothetical protein